MPMQLYSSCKPNSPPASNALRVARDRRQVTDQPQAPNQRPPKLPKSPAVAACCEGSFPASLLLEDAAPEQADDTGDRRYSRLGAGGFLLGWWPGQPCAPAARPPSRPAAWLQGRLAAQPRGCLLAWLNARSPISARSGRGLCDPFQDGSCARQGWKGPSFSREAKVRVQTAPPTPAEPRATSCSFDISPKAVPLGARCTTNCTRTHLAAARPVQVSG